MTKIRISIWKEYFFLKKNKNLYKTTEQTHDIFFAVNLVKKFLCFTNHALCSTH